MLIPMVVLQVKAREEEELLTLHPITGPKEVVEGEEVEFRMRLTRATRGKSACSATQPGACCTPCASQPGLDTEEYAVCGEALVK